MAVLGSMSWGSQCTVTVKELAEFVRAIESVGGTAIASTIGPDVAGGYAVKIEGRLKRKRSSSSSAETGRIDSSSLVENL